jgi:hypothetical protein
MIARAEATGCDWCMKKEELLSSRPADLQICRLVYIIPQLFRYINIMTQSGIVGSVTTNAVFSILRNRVA